MRREERDPAPRAVVVPGAAVRSYVLPAARCLQERGWEAELVAAPGAPGAAGELREYGAQLAARLAAQPPIDVLIGLSVGAQAAAVAAAATPDRVRHLMLVSPTVDPRARSAPQLLGRWLAGGRLEPARLLREQAPEWWRAGPRRLAQLVGSALEIRLEQVLTGWPGGLTVVHGEADVITSHGYAAALATQHDARLLIVPAATHSWPYGDPARFADTVAAVARTGPPGPAPGGEDPAVADPRR